MDQSQLRSFLKSILPSLSLLAGAETNIELGAVVTPPVHIHRMFLHRVLMQLIRNVSELNVDRPLAFISVRRVHQWCEVSVADNGPVLNDLSPNDILYLGSPPKAPKAPEGLDYLLWLGSLKIGEGNMAMKQFPKIMDAGSGFASLYLTFKLAFPTNQIIIL